MKKHVTRSHLLPVVVLGTLAFLLELPIHVLIASFTGFL
jgi:hypothetical protein